MLYHCTNLYLPTFFWKESHILFYCYGIDTILSSQFRERPV